MSVDTRDKRFSMLGFGQGRGAPYVLPNPDGAVDEADRPQWAYLYHGSGIAITVGGQPMMRRWGGVPHMTPGRRWAGGSW